LMRLNHQVETVVMIDSPLVIGGAALRIPREASGAHGQVAAPDDVPIEPVSPAFDWGLERYQRCVAAYSPSPVPARLLVLASEFDGRDWIRLSGDAELLEIPGGHFDWVTFRINDLVRNLRSWLSGDASLGVSVRRPSENNETSPAGSSSREVRQSLARENEGKVLALSLSNEEIPPGLSAATINDALLLRLRSILNYARRGDKRRYSAR
jgi:hypothetical protein